MSTLKKGHVVDETLFESMRNIFSANTNGMDMFGFRLIYPENNSKYITDNMIGCVENVKSMFKKPKNDFWKFKQTRVRYVWGSYEFLFTYEYNNKKLHYLIYVSMDETITLRTFTTYGDDWTHKNERKFIWDNATFVVDNTKEN